jgi:hypothetical protein
MNLPTPLLVLWFLRKFSSVGRFRAPIFGGSIGPTPLWKFPRENKVLRNHHSVIKDLR